jgi:hypothetical protein
VLADLLTYWRKARALPTKVVLGKIINKSRSLINYKFAEIRDQLSPSFYDDYKPSSPLMTRLVGKCIPLINEEYADTLAQLCKYYLEHRFDLLGSGWVQVRHGMVCRGLEGHRYQMAGPVHAEQDFLNTANYREVRRIRECISKRYQPIDWHLDFKSGYRWEPKTWYRDIPYGHLPGVDIKVPWELSRLQHLPQLAQAYYYAIRNSNDFEQAEVYKFEFRNQVLDFISANPPRFGVNWACTMDVAIRAANLLIAYDIFSGADANFDPQFDSIFIRSIYEHGVHITKNLEWSKDLRGNHYLADIAGLLFVSSYLPSSAETDTWLAFSVQELVQEVGSQFYEDGGNFEASTVYHRLSAEIVVYCTALVLGFDQEKMNRLVNYESSLWSYIPPLSPSPIKMFPICTCEENSEILLSPFPSWYFERLELMAEFSMHTTKQSGQIIQIGDNDSGRFFKIAPVFHLLTVRETVTNYQHLHGYDDLTDNEPYLIEDNLNHSHLVAAINGLFQRLDFESFLKGQNYETRFVSAFSRNIKIKSYLSSDINNRIKSKFKNFSDVDLTKFTNKDLISKNTQLPFDGISLIIGLEQFIYRDFGIYIFRSNRVFLAIRAGTVGQNGFGGHAHNDQLSVELQVDGKDIISDPGTFIYTPLPVSRNQYRSIHSHFAPAIDGKESGAIDLGLFRLGNSISGVCLMLGEAEIVCQAIGGIATVIRHVKISNNNVSITDYFPPDHFITCQKAPLSYSPGYGQVYAQ